MKIAIISLLGASCIAHAQPVTGNQLFEDLNGLVACTTKVETCSDDGTFRGLYALGFVTGVAEVTGRQGLHCQPAGATKGQATDVVRQWLSTHPQDRHQPAAVLVWRALSETWPCPRR